MMNFKNWLLIIESTEFSERTNELCFGELLDKLPEFLKKDREKASSILQRNVRGKEDRLTTQTFLDLRSIFDYRHSVIGYKVNSPTDYRKWVVSKNIAADSAEYEDLQNKANFLNSVTLDKASSVYDKLKELQPLLDEQKIVREVRDSSGVKYLVSWPLYTAINSGTTSGLETYRIIKVWQDYIEGLMSIQKSRKEIQAEKQAVKDKKAAEITKVADASSVVTLDSKIDSLLENEKTRFINAKLDDYKLNQISFNKKVDKYDEKEIKNIKTQLWYRAVVNKTDDEAKELINRELWTRLRDFFKMRIMEKISGIIQYKKTVDGSDFDIVENRPTFFDGTLDCDWKITFTDGSSFNLKQRAVYSTSVLGNPFYRFPTTFHHVILPNGERMVNPSVSSIYKDFVKIPEPDISDVSMME